MRMSIQNEMPGYNAVDQLLNQQGVGLTPAEMHGLISGILCGGNKDSSWQPLVHDLTNEGLAFGHELAQALRNMHSATSDALEDDGFLFQRIGCSLVNKIIGRIRWFNQWQIAHNQIAQPDQERRKDNRNQP